MHVCLVCQSFVFSNKGVLCEFCLEKFSARVRSSGLIVRRRPIFTQSLWSWDSETEEISRALVYGLKNFSQKSKWMWASSLLTSFALPIDERSCLVPIPSKSGKPDHAWGLANAISKLTGLPVENVLTVEGGSGHQRERNRAQRRSIAFVKARRLKRAYSNYIIVDDVVTSGATLHAAFLALKKPEHIQGLCFIDRRLVADYDEACYKQRQ